MSDNAVTMTLPKAEALVLFEWIAGLDERGDQIDDDVAKKVLWVLEGQLESALVEPLQPNYLEVIAEARRKVLEKWGE